MSGLSPGTLPLRTLAPAKINLGLFVGPVREQDARHELVSVMQSISLADELRLESIESVETGGGEGVETGGGEGVETGGGEGVETGGGESVETGGGEGVETGGGEDEIICPGVPGAPGENLAAAALRAFRAATGWDAPPLRLSIAKRIPIAAGLGGGSADAAATLRLARHASGLGSDELLLELAGQLGADVPAQVAPGRWLARGAGERLRELVAPNHPFGVLVLPIPTELSTGAVYERADDLDVPREERALEELAGRMRAAFELGAAIPDARELLHNDLQTSAMSLCPPIAPTLKLVQEAGVDAAFVSGSGPTVVGLFVRANGPERARRAAEGLRGRTPPAICAVPVDSAFAQVDAAGAADATAGG